MTFQKEEICEGCQKKIKVYSIQIMGGENKGQWQEWRKGCVCEEMKMAKQAIDNKKNQKLRRTKEIFNRNSLISKDLEKASFDNFEPNNDLQKYMKKVSGRYVDIFKLDEPRNLVFSGSFGLGKSHLAKAIADGIMGNDYTAIFISVPKLLRKIKSTYSNESKINEDDIIQTLEQVDCLILDDLGAEKSSDWTAERIFDIIDSRQGKHTVYTTNYTPDDLVKRLGERNFSRVINRDTTVLEVEGNNYRLQDMKG